MSEGFLAMHLLTNILSLFLLHLRSLEDEWLLKLFSVSQLTNKNLYIKYYSRLSNYGKVLKILLIPKKNKLNRRQYRQNHTKRQPHFHSLEHKGSELYSAMKPWRPPWSGNSKQFVYSPDIRWVLDNNYKAIR